MNSDETKRSVSRAADNAAHSAEADKAKGHTKEVIGTVKEKVGRLIGDHDLEAGGAVQNAEGKKDRLKGEIKEKIDDVTDTVKAGVEVIKDKIHGR